MLELWQLLWTESDGRCIKRIKNALFPPRNYILSTKKDDPSLCYQKIAMSTVHLPTQLQSKACHDVPVGAKVKIVRNVNLVTFVWFVRFVDVGFVFASFHGEASG